MTMHKLSTSTWDEREIQAATAVLRSGNCTMGEVTRQYENAFADYIGTKYAVACNSGSSANLLMVAAYTLRYGPGIVAVPALGWSTSYSPFQQYGWKLRFVDIDLDTLNYDLPALWNANEKNDVDVILAINVLGNPNEFSGFPRHARILEDNCEALGATYHNHRTGTFGVMASHSTFFSHHICTIEGGMVTTDDKHFYHMLLALRSHGWTRNLPAKNALGVTPGQWDFILPGYNVRPTEISSAIGLVQLEKLPGIIERRRENARTFPFCAQKEIGESSWYGFAVHWKDVTKVIGKCETRPLLTGNFVRSPSIQYYNYEVHGKLTNTDYVQNHYLMIGNHGTPIDWSFLSA